jgi:hypothetical protein
MGRNQFAAWLTVVEKLYIRPERVDITAWASEHNKDTNDVSVLNEFVTFVCHSFGTTDHHSDQTFVIPAGFEEKLTITPQNRGGDFMLALQITAFPRTTTLKDFKIKELTLHNHVGKIVLSNIVVYNLSITGVGDFDIRDCLIGTLNLRGRAASDFEIYGGMIFNIICSPPASELPFNGSVHFDRSVYLPKKSNEQMRGAQAYRNLRSHMAKLENTPMVSRFNRLEQLVERERQTRFDRSISNLYQLLSDYGSSSLRPVLWFILLFLITFVLVLRVDGADKGNPNELAGWQTTLFKEGLAPEVERAFVLTMQSTLNPVGVFGTKGLIVAKYDWLAGWLILHGLLSALFIALFIFAVRRRFKMS